MSVCMYFFWCIVRTKRTKCPHNLFEKKKKNPKYSPLLRRLGLGLGVGIVLTGYSNHYVSGSSAHTVCVYRCSDYTIYCLLIDIAILAFISITENCSMQRAYSPAVAISRHIVWW